jgi:ubiquinone/menaquinone biosynthesis C-methylase UbiE
MSPFAARLKARYFTDPHPYELFEEEVKQYLRPGDTLLDAGCGRTAPVLQKFKGRARRLIGVDRVEYPEQQDGLELYRCDLSTTPLDDACVDIAMARSVMEHIGDPESVYREMHRVLKPGGYFLFLTANFWDYASMIAWIIPNRWHPWIVSRTEGRLEQDVFPIAYRTNTRRAIKRWSRSAGFQIVSMRYLGQYPCYFMFNAPLFLLATGYEKLIGRVPSLHFLRGWILVTLRKT